MAFNDSTTTTSTSSDLQNSEEQLLEDNYLEPIQLNLNNTNGNNKRKSIALLNIESANQLKNIIRSTNTKFTNTLRLIRTKSLSTNAPENKTALSISQTDAVESTFNKNLKRYLTTNTSITNSKIEISEPTLISQTFDITKQNYIEINMNYNPLLRITIDY